MDFHRGIQIGRLLRLLEAAAAILLLSWSSLHLPAAARLSADFLRRLAAVLLSPAFVFLLGNAIVLLLVAKSGAAGKEAAAAEDFLGIRSRLAAASSAVPAPAEVVYEDKAVCVEAAAGARRPEAAEEETGREYSVEEEVEKEYSGEDEEEEEEGGEDAEEFRQTVEAFIARQLRVRREEDTVCCSAGTPERNIKIKCY